MSLHPDRDAKQLAVLCSQNNQELSVFDTLDFFFIHAPIYYR